MRCRSEIFSLTALVQVLAQRDGHAVDVGELDNITCASAALSFMGEHGELEATCPQLS